MRNATIRDRLFALGLLLLVGLVVAQGVDQIRQNKILNRNQHALAKIAHANHLAALVAIRACHRTRILAPAQYDYFRRVHALSPRLLDLYAETVPKTCP